MEGIDIHNGQTECKIYIKDKKNIEGIKEKFSVITNSKTGRAKLGSKLAKKEYNYLKKNGELDLFDLRRDSQTLVMNKKSVAEADAVKRAQE